MVRVAFGLGGNLGDRLAALQGAVDFICADPRVRPVSVSAVVESDPVGGPAQPDYLNAVLVAECTAPARELLALSQAAEAAAGRVPGERWGPRTLDVDVLAVAGTQVAEPDLVVPHPRALQRAFVLIPWSQIDPDFEVPGTGLTVRQALAALDHRQKRAVRPHDGVLRLSRSA